MSRQLISEYQEEVERIIQYGGSRKETSIRGAFQNLLNVYCRARDFLLIPELDYATKSGKVVYPDGTVKDALRLDWGYWESKDPDDNLDLEIEGKLALGYPNDNILFEDSHTAVLIQGGEETMRVSMEDVEALDEIITAFVDYVRPEVKDFRSAVASFKEDLPTILTALRDLMEHQSQINGKYQRARDSFLTICHQSINPEVTLLDVREMIIQHILTEDIFVSIFNESQFHRENNIARELQRVLDTFFTGVTKKNTLHTIERYYGVIRRTAAQISNHQEKQKFLKAVYENFYQAYNPKGADRLGIVYTPGEIVGFMIESVDYLLHRHFSKLLGDSGVKIMDPATGTGTFITELIEYLPKNRLLYKYQKEIYCNEVAILPYYIANLNIEFTYQQKMDTYKEFENICFVDTLEHSTFHQQQLDLFAMTVENTTRIKRQNDSEIAVILGNPPYNANQKNENENNKNRSYSAIDKRIKESYVKESGAQKTKLYDMYTRFLRWGSDRLGKNGVLAFITNSSFIDGRSFDGFRKVVAREFREIYILDLGGNVRKNPQLSGTTHNVFGIQTGVAISFMVKREGDNTQPCKIFYSSRAELERAEEKLQFLATTKFDKINFEHIIPDKHYNWINIVHNDFDSLLSLVEKRKTAGSITETVFEYCTNGISTNRDEWVYDFQREELISKVSFFIKKYNEDVARYQKAGKVKNIGYFVNYEIKWSRDLKKHLVAGKTAHKLSPDKVIGQLYRPFVTKYYYADSLLSDRLTRNHTQLFGENFQKENLVIYFSGPPLSKPFQVLGSTYSCDLHFLGDAQSLPLYRYDQEGNRHDNITDWGLGEFQNHYQNRRIKKEDIFYYTYGILHNPVYRKKYELNLKREFPRLPFYEDFFQWVDWGKQLMELHVNYETGQLYPLYEQRRKGERVKLKVDKTKGDIIIDEVTTLTGVPEIAWEYKLGNHSALQWVLDQYQEKKPRDKTIAAKFNHYRFADYKAKVIDLLQRVCYLSVETMGILASMEPVHNKR